jgi:hypothetical protein
MKVSSLSVQLLKSGTVRNRSILGSATNAPGVYQRRGSGTNG